MPLETYPHLDPTVKYVNASKLRELSSSERLRETTDTFVIQEDSKPIRVLLTYEKYLAMQEELGAVARTVEMLSDAVEREALRKAAEDMKAGRVKTLEQIDEEVKKRRG
jgi:hypothetical protein